MYELIIVSATSNNNLALANEIDKCAKEKNINSKVLNLEELNLPLYTPNEEKKSGIPQNILNITDEMINTKTFIFVAPEYNGLTPPILVNFVAWLSRSTEDYRKIFNSKYIALATHSGSDAPKLMMAMRMQFQHLGANLIGREIVTNYQKKLNPKALDEILKQLKKIL